MVSPDKHEQHLAIVRATEIADSDDDIIREELDRRSEFDRQHKKDMTRLPEVP